jgi:hypothetical protein
MQTNYICWSAKLSDTISLTARLKFFQKSLPRPTWKQAFPGYAAQLTSKSAAKLVLKDCGMRFETCH